MFLKNSFRYFLSETGTPAKQAAKANDSAAKARQIAAQKAEEKKQLLAAQAAEKKRQVEEKNRLAAEKKAKLAEKKKQEQAARSKQAAAKSVVSQAKRGSTISLFGLGGGSEPASSAPAPIKKSPTLRLKPPEKSAEATAPKGVPTLSGWKLNGDGTVSGRISGSPNFKQGELITTSPIQKGRIDSGSVVQTGSGSRYFLG